MTACATPTSESALREAVLEAKASNTRLRIVAGGTRSQIGNPGTVAQALDTSGLAGITRYEPGSLTLEAKAGTPLQEIEAALAAEGQMLAFEPMDHRPLLGTSGEPTIGGVVACNVSGPRRFIAGACRDYILGIRYVDGQGRLIANGGRVMKNVTGLDLTKLACGAYGTLGVLSEIALKVLPRPERAATLQFTDVTEAEAVGLFCRATTTPYEVSGAAWQNGTAMVRVEGLSAQVDYRLSKLRDLLGGGSVLEGDLHDTIWTGIRDVHVFSGTRDTIWKLSLKPTDAPQVIEAARHKLEARAVLDQGGALIWLAVPSDAPDQAETIRGLIPQGAGHATLIRGSTELRRTVPVFHPQHPRLQQISDQLRAQFDPDGLLNPNLMAA